LNQGDFDNLVLRVTERLAAGRYSEKHGLVTSYDPKNHLAKVTLQPGGQETGWLPIEVDHIGKGYGILIGLQPGKGAVSDQGQGGQVGPQQDNQGDQVVVRFQENDVEAGKVVKRVHSNTDTPPTVQSGEMLFYTQFQKSGGQKPDSASGGQGGTGQQIYLKNDGSVVITDGNGATIIWDGQGNINVQINKLSVQAKSTITINGDADVDIKASGALNLNGSPINLNGGGPTVPPFTVPG
jgi:phage baseplate assembly protein gpV